MKWLAWQDDELPDGVHTALVMTLAAALAAPCVWTGLPALLSGSLPPVMGPDFGTWLFGPHALTGRAARLAGSSLLVLGLVCLAGGLATTRWAEGRRGVRGLFWALVALDLLLYLGAVRSA